ncbi:hypothetical protein Q3G72_025681 [Acer saccharum]|nr:hypothetical protein Q3G72_025681 [Acer saccharum]
MMFPCDIHNTCYSSHRLYPLVVPPLLPVATSCSDEASRRRFQSHQLFRRSFSPSLPVASSFSSSLESVDGKNFIGILVTASQPFIFQEYQHLCTS